MEFSLVSMNPPSSSHAVSSGGGLCLVMGYQSTINPYGARPVHPYPYSSDLSLHVPCSTWPRRHFCTSCTFAGDRLWVQHLITRRWDQTGEIISMRDTERSYIVSIGEKEEVRNRRFLRKMPATDIASPEKKTDRFYLLHYLEGKEELRVLFLLSCSPPSSPPSSPSLLYSVIVFVLAIYSDPTVYVHA